MNCALSTSAVCPICGTKLRSSVGEGSTRVSIHLDKLAQVPILGGLRAPIGDLPNPVRSVVEDADRAVPAFDGSGLEDVDHPLANPALTLRELGRPPAAPTSGRSIGATAAVGAAAPFPDDDANRAISATLLSRACAASTNARRRADSSGDTPELAMSSSGLLRFIELAARARARASVPVFCAAACREHQASVFRIWLLCHLTDDCAMKYLNLCVCDRARRRRLPGGSAPSLVQTSVSGIRIG